MDAQGDMDVDVDKLLRGGEPVVCMATRIAFHQEQEYLSRIRTARSSGGAVPRINIEIVPNTAAAQDMPVARKEPDE